MSYAMDMAVILCWEVNVYLVCGGYQKTYVVETMKLRPAADMPEL